jgi:hypothetical protein
MSTDIHGKHLYSYSYDGSTQIGVIEPTMSEINKYYTGGPRWIVVDTSSTSYGRRFYNSIKVGIKNHLAKSNNEATRQREMNSRIFMENVRRSKSMDNARKVKRYANRVNPNTIKVRRFD